MKRSVVAVLFMAAGLAVPGRLLAHEGHAHKVMGTVSMADAKHIEVDATDGKKVSIALTTETKYLKPAPTPPGGPDQPAAASELKVGQRVVVTVVEGEGKKTAKEIVLGAGGDKASPHHH